MPFSNQPFSEADFQDIQGLVRFGHGHLERRALLFAEHRGCRRRARLACRSAGDECGQRLGCPTSRFKSPSHMTD